MKIKVKFVGDDLTFYDDVKERYQKMYQGTGFEFTHASLKDDANPIAIFKSLYEHRVDVIFIDYEDHKDLASQISLLVNSNAELRKKSFCALHGYKDRVESIDTALLSQVRINHIKGIELHDIIFDTMTFFDPAKARAMPFIKGDEIDEFNFYYQLRVTQLRKGCLHVETNLELNENEIIELDQHPLDHIINSKKFLVTNQNNANLFYNTRFSYDLEFTYIDDNFFRSTEQYFLDSLKYKDKKAEYEKKTGEDYDQMMRLVKARANKVAHFKAEVKDWVQSNKNEEIKKIKVLIFDDELKSIEQVQKIEDFTIKYETGLIFDYYQVRRYRPHVIIFNITEKHDESQVQQLFNYLSSEKKAPYVIVTNTDETFQYKKVITFPIGLKTQTLKELLKAFKEKVDISTDQDRVFFDKDHKRVNATAKFEGTVIKMSESEAYFTCDYTIPDWTVLEIRKPIPMLLTVVPHLENSEFQKEPNIYRALINGTTEPVKADLRVMINQSFVEEEEVEEGSEEE